jgi:hypothetical protein
MITDIELLNVSMYYAGSGSIENDQHFSPVQIPFHLDEPAGG